MRIRRQAINHNFIKDKEGSIQALGDIYLYGKEINDETYAICKSDMMIKGNDPSNIKMVQLYQLMNSQICSTTSQILRRERLVIDLKYIKDGKEVIDQRFW